MAAATSVARFIKGFPQPVLTRVQGTQGDGQRQPQRRQKYLQHAAQKAAAASAHAEAQAHAALAQAEARAHAALADKQVNDPRHPPQPHPPVAITNAPWFYADPQGNIQGPFKGVKMRQWIDTGYFKGDLPVSQNPTGQFRALTDLFRDLSVAFQVPRPVLPPPPLPKRVDRLNTPVM